MLVLGLGLCLAGCGPTEISKQEAGKFIERWSRLYPKKLQQHKDLSVAALKMQLETHSDVENTNLKGAILGAYEDVETTFYFVENGELTQKGRSARETLMSIGKEALEPARFERAKIETLIKELDDVEKRLEKLTPLVFDGDVRKKLVTWLSSKTASSFRLSEANFSKVGTFLEKTAPPAYESTIRKLRQLYARRHELSQKVEASLAWFIAKYGYVQRHHRVRDIYIHPRHADRWNYPNIKGGRPDKAEAAFRAGEVWRTAGALTREMQNVSEILKRRIEGMLRDSYRDSVADVVEEVKPQHPQYTRLVETYREYRKLYDSGGWDYVKPLQNLAPKDSHPRVIELKERLRAEGFFEKEGQFDEYYGDGLEDAIREYQRTHQMRVTGQPHNLFWSSLNVPVERRLKQIKINIQRWRSTNIRYEEPYFGVVNIPGFMARLWRNQEVIQETAIVVGNNQARPRLKKDQDTEADKEDEEPPHPNRTPRLSAYVDRVIYNPYWNVTPRIRREEILPKVRASVEESYRARISAQIEKKKAGEDSFLSSVLGETGLADSEDANGENASAGPPAENSPQGDSPETSPEEQKGKPEMREALSQYLSKKRVDSLLGTSEQISPNLLQALPERSRTRYVFDVTSLLDLYGLESGKTGKKELQKRFPYLDLSRQIVDVSKTNPDAIPGWYEENGYEVVNPGKSWEYVRMLQGEDNALGRVKIIFPNQKWVYLHDTPKKALFDHAIRAYSHGCMRMEKPLAMAQKILEVDGILNEYDIDKILEGDEPDKKEQTPIFLQKPFPIHVDYFTVRVGEDGNPHFFADVYDYDEKMIEEGRVTLME
jgi:murein L,D-transpeptidase YcbB/YkuD